METEIGWQILFRPIPQDCDADLIFKAAVMLDGNYVFLSKEVLNSILGFFIGNCHALVIKEIVRFFRSHFVLNRAYDLAVVSCYPDYGSPRLFECLINAADDQQGILI